VALLFFVETAAESDQLFEELLDGSAVEAELSRRELKIHSI
jgi:hypothetical protein